MKTLSRLFRYGALASAVVGVTPLVTPLAAAAQDAPVALPDILVTASRLGAGVTGSSTTVITAEDIARAPDATVQDLLGRVPGIQTWSTGGGINGAGTVVDMRGFGATAASNTLVLINGRRLTDIDLAGVDFSSIPRQSIERIEITRGNSGAVLYGDGAVGGVINIITKNGVGSPATGRIEGGFGSFQQREGTVSAAASNGTFATSVYGTAIDSNGYRVNNALRQRDAVGDIRYTGSDGTAYLNVSGDDQHLGLPGPRRVTLTSSELATDPTGATTPTAFADKKGANLTLGVTRAVAKDFEIVLDGGVRNKKQDAFSTLFGFTTSDARELTTLSLTPRLNITRELFGLPSKVLAGVDVYDAKLAVNRSTQLSDPPIHRYDLSQTTVGAYWQHTIGVLPSTDISYGAREQFTQVRAHDTFDITAPGASPFDAQAIPLARQEWNYALHLGAEHRFNDVLSVFGRFGHSFRTPNVDERIGVNAFPVNFDLKTQTSRDMEAGLRVHAGALDLQSSVYDMRLNNEILFIPFPPIGANINLDPTRRYGVENSVSLRVSETVRVRGGLTYTRAVFRGGPFAGNDVPLVSKWSGSAGLSWDIMPKAMVMDAVVHFTGARRMDNDQANFQPLIPGWTTMDLRLGGEVQNFFWSVAVQNLFNVAYYDYAVASSATFGTFNAYPQPGRTFMVRAGAKF